MAITSTKENADQREVILSDDGMELIRSFVIVTDDPEQDVVQLTNAVGLPQRDDSHPFNPIAFVDDVVITQRSGAMTVFDAIITYRTPGDTPESPLDRPVDVQWGAIRTQESYQQDVNGIPISNSAGVPFDPPVVRDVTRPVLTLVRNELSFNIGFLVSFFDTVNVGVFFNALPGQVKFSGASATKEKENNVTFWRITYEFHFRNERWDELKLLDQGMSALGLVAGQTELKAIVRAVVDPVTSDTTYIPITEPVPLNGVGGILPPGGEVFYGTYHPYRTRNFDALGFDL